MRVIEEIGSLLVLEHNGAHLVIEELGDEDRAVGNYWRLYPDEKTTLDKAVWDTNVSPEGLHDLIETAWGSYQDARENLYAGRFNPYNERD